MDQNDDGCPPVRSESDPAVGGQPVGSLMKSQNDQGGLDVSERTQGSTHGRTQQGKSEIASKPVAAALPPEWRPSWQRVQAHIDLAMKRKTAGNAAYKAGNTVEAITMYSSSAATVHSLEGVLSDLEKAGVAQLPSRPEEASALTDDELAREGRARAGDASSNGDTDCNKNDGGDTGPVKGRGRGIWAKATTGEDGPVSIDEALAREMDRDAGRPSTGGKDASSGSHDVVTGTESKEEEEDGAGASSGPEMGSGSVSGAVPIGRTAGEYLQELRSMVAKVYANRGQVRMRCDEWTEAIADCDEALDRDPQYLKAMLRRATCLEKLDQWEDAVEDWQDVLRADPRSAEGRAGLARCEEKKKKKEEGMKDEMMGKLKDLGNMVLGNFGLSVDNFELKQDQSGGYSVQFNQNPGSGKEGEGGVAAGGGQPPATAPGGVDGSASGGNTSTGKGTGAGTGTGTGAGANGFSFSFDGSGVGAGAGARGSGGAGGKQEGGARRHPRPHEEAGMGMGRWDAEEEEEEEEDILE